MALSPNSATFREIVSNFEEAGLDPVSEESLAMLSRVNPDLDIEKYKTVYGDYQKIMANPDFAKLYFKDDRTFDPGAAVASGVSRAGEAISSLSLDAIETGANIAAVGKFGFETLTGIEDNFYVDPKKIRATISNFFSDALDAVDDKLYKSGRLGKSISYAIGNTADPNVNIGEDIAGYFLPATGAAKFLTAATKGVKPATKFGKFAKGTAIGIGSDVLVRKEDEQFAAELIGLLGPKGEKAAAALAINPEDTAAQRRFKQLIDSTLGAAVAAPVTLGVIKTLGLAYQKTLGKTKAVKTDDVLEPVEPVDGIKPVQAEVVEVAPNKYQQRGKFVETIGDINTIVGKAATSRAGLSEDIYEASLRASADPNNILRLLQAMSKPLKKAIKKSGNDPQEVNKFILGDASAAKNLSDDVIREAQKLREFIDKNTVKIKEGLNLADDSELAMIFDSNIGGYLTRGYELFTNPKWSKKIHEALKANPKRFKEIMETGGFGLRQASRDHNAHVYRIVYDARRYLQKKYPDLPPERIDGIIESIINNPNQSEIIDLLTRGTYPGAAKASQVLRKRKKIDKPLLELMGEIKDPVQNFIATARNQNKLLTQLNFYNEIADIASKNLNRPVTMGGFFPGLPRRETTFTTGETKGGFIENLGQIATREFGVEGFGENLPIHKFFTDKATIKAIEKGIDVFGFDKPKAGLGNLGLQLFSRPAGLAQAAETVYDHTAHMLNLYGMAQQLAMNGGWYRPSFYKGAAKGAYDTFRKAVGGDVAAQQRILALKNAGVLDSNVDAQVVLRNLDRFGNTTEGLIEKGLRTTYRVPGYFYGAVDDFAKMTQFEVELANAKARLGKNATEQQLFNMAATRVRDVMPSYTSAAPAVRALSRLPFGTYAVFPAEILRTQKNIIKYGLKDLIEGVANKNAKQIQAGGEKIVGIAATTIGIEYYINQNNEELGVSPKDAKVISDIGAPWQRSSNKIFTQPLIMETVTVRGEKQDKLFAYYVDSGLIDAQQFVKGPIKQIYGRLAAGENVTEREVDAFYENALRDVLGPFVSEKFLTTALLNISRNVDAEGRPITTGTDPGIFGRDNLNRAVEVLKSFEPGSYKAYDKDRRAEESERLRGAGLGQTPSGFPLRKADTEAFLTTGIRFNTVDVFKSMGSMVYEQTQLIKATDREFAAILKQIPDREFTEEDQQLIVDEYIRLNDRKLDQVRVLKDMVNEFKTLEYLIYNPKTKKYNQVNVTSDNIIQGATDFFEYDASDELLDVLNTNEFISPVQIAYDRGIKGVDPEILEKVRGQTSGVSFGLFDRLMAEQEKYQGRPIYKTEE